MATTAGSIAPILLPLSEGAIESTWPDLTVTSGVTGSMLALLLAHRCKQRTTAARARAATRIQAHHRGCTARWQFTCELVARLLVLERTQARKQVTAANTIRLACRGWRARRTQAEAANTIRFYYCWWRARRAVVLQRTWRGCRARLMYKAITKASVDLSVLSLSAVFHLGDGSLHAITYASRDPNRELSCHVQDSVVDSTRRLGIARLLLRMKRAPNAKKQHARRAAAEARWKLQERDREQKFISGSIATIHGLLYLVPDSLGGRAGGLELAALAYGGIPGFLPFDGQAAESDDDSSGFDRFAWGSDEEASMFYG